VVYSERAIRWTNSNRGLLSELAQATAFIAHPYHWPVGRAAHRYRIVDHGRSESHWLMGYAPNNCVAVIVGDVTFENAMQLSRKYLEPIPRRTPPPPVRTKEPEQQGERRVTLVKPAQLPCR